jgi:nucleoside-diphosphate-sugar epimerase
VNEIHKNPHLQNTYDTVINYILLHQESIERNIEFLRSLLQFCEQHAVKHLIHISSCSVYRNSARNVDEDSPIEVDPKKKGPYAALKAAQEAYITEHAPKRLKVSHLRPGLILANGMGGYIGGIGIRLPWNSIIGLGSAKSQLPIVTRDAVNKTVAFLVNNPPEEDLDVLLLAASPSPTRRQYLQDCCAVLGVGTKVRFFPVSIWLWAGFMAEIMTRLIGRRRLGILGKVRSVCRFQEFDARKTEERVGISFSANWKEEIERAFDFQAKNFEIPSDLELKKTVAKKITFVGYGRIVKQRHLPELRKLRFNGSIEAFDLWEGRDDSGQSIQDIRRVKPSSSDLFVVATPGPVHVNAIEFLKGTQGPIMIEKPLAYNIEEVNQWVEFSRNRKDPIYVCHDRRYKDNVLAMMRFLRKYNPGRLLNVNVIFQSPPVNKDPAPWLRAERKSRALLMDYGLHQIDLACMFGKGKPLLKDCQYELNGQGETCLIEGQAVFDNYSIHFLFRQGINQNRNKLVFTFQNYSVTLGFAPDIFVPHLSDDNFGLALIEAWRSFKSTCNKVVDKLSGGESETSHAYAFQTAIGGNRDEPLFIDNLRPVYNLLFQISERVYPEGS